MNRYSTLQQQDEGYSEHPLNSSVELYPLKPQHDGTIVKLQQIAPDLSDLLTGHLSSLTTDEKTWLALRLLDDLPTSIISEIYSKLYPRLYIDFVRQLPAEICLKILGYLDPESLISVARTCRSWNDLVWDHRLWESRYILEGWKFHSDDLRLALNHANDTLLSLETSPAATSPDKTQTILSYDDNEDDDTVMVDVLSQEPQQISGTQSSIFAGASSSNRTGATTTFKGLDLGPTSTATPLDKGKGKAVEVADDVATKTKSASDLWQWDRSSNRYKPNWRHLFTMRKKLEANWEQGNYKQFQLPHPDHPEEGHQNECIYALQFDKKYLVSGSRDRTLRRWDMKTRRLIGKPLAGHNGSVLCLQFDSDPDEDIIVSGSSDSNVIIWKFSTGEMLHKLDTAHRESVLNIRFDKRILVTCSKDKTIKIFNRRPLPIDTPGYQDMPMVRQLARSHKESNPTAGPLIIPPYTLIQVLHGHSAAVNSVQIVENEVVSASGDRTMKVWDWQTGVCLRTFVGHQKGIACVLYDGRRVVSGSSDHEIKVYCRETGVEVASLRGHTDLVRTVQAGFADLPDSKEADLVEAKRVDQLLFDAMKNDALPEVPLRGRPGNAGGSRPEDVTSWGGKVPPGGGGGRYARIVSGSYDKSIIIWRRDKTGAWKPRITLRYEHLPFRMVNGQTSAGPFMAEMAGNSRSGSHVPQLPSTAAPMSITNTPLVADPEGETTSLNEPSGSSLPVQPTQSRLRSALRPTHPPPFTSQAAARRWRPRNDTAAVSTSAVAGSNDVSLSATSETMPNPPTTVDLIVAQGVHSLLDALLNYPGLLTVQDQINSAIAREPDQLVRQQLRQVVNNAILRQQLTDQRARDRSFESHMPEFTAHSSSSHLSTALPPPPSTAWTGPATDGPSRMSRLSNAYNARYRHTMGSSVQTMFSSRAAEAAGNVGAEWTPSMQLTSSQVNGSSSQPQPQSQPGPADADTTMQTMATDTSSTNPVVAGAPRISHAQAAAIATDTSAYATRIYKLQFDASRIICCSQTSVIVGWDFCNGDPQLEEAAQFFATVD